MVGTGVPATWFNNQFSSEKNASICEKVPCEKKPADWKSALFSGAGVGENKRIHQPRNKGSQDTCLVPVTSHERLRHIYDQMKIRRDGTLIPTSAPVENMQEHGVLECIGFEIGSD